MPTRIPGQIRIAFAKVVVLCLTLGSGCDRAKPQDPVVAELESHLSTPDLAARKRIELALSMRRNNTVDSQPVLIKANVPRDLAYGKNVLVMMMYDEDKDIIGIGIREERGPADQERSIFLEEYPAYVHQPRGGPVPYAIVPIHFRDSDQRKDGQQWQDYVEGKGFDKNAITNRTRLWETLPPIYLSAPESNGTDVFVYVYDQAGHKSDVVKLQAMR